MKVLLISSNTADEPYAVFPLGVGVVARSLIEAGHEIRIFDCLMMGQTLETVVNDFLPDIIGVGIRNIDNVNFLDPVFYLDDAVRLVQELRAISQVPIFAGGAGFSLMPEKILEYIGADYGIAGAGERAVLEMLDAIDSGLSTKRIFHACGSDGGVGRCHYDRRISEFYLRETGILSVQTKRGCPKKCVYCSYPLLEGRQVYCRDTGETLEELRFLQREFAPETIYFTDSIFNDADGKYLELLEAIVRHDLNISWSAFFTPENFDRASVELMKRSGIKNVELGMDACSDATLRGLGKDYDFNTVVSSCELFRSVGIPVSSSCIAGGPGENHRTMSEGIKNLSRLDGVANFVFMGIRILPGAAIERIALEQGVLASGTDLLKPVFYLSPEIDSQELFDGLSKGFRGVKHVVFPPQSRNEELKFFRKLQARAGGNS